MSDAPTRSGRLQHWDGHAPDLRAWSDPELLDALSQLGIQTNRDAFTAEAVVATTQAAVEDTWLMAAKDASDGERVLIWMAVQELWERWRVPAWPRDRMGRMFAYLVDAEFAAEWAARCHAPTGAEVIEALDAFLAAQGGGRRALDSLVEEMGMPAAAWPAKTLDAMGEWIEVGNLALAERSGEVMAKALGEGHTQAFLAAAMMTTRMYDRARAAALAVPHEADVRGGFAEMVGFLCLAAGSRPSARYWLLEAQGRTRPRKSELTFAAEAVRDYVGAADTDGGDGVVAQVPEEMRKAAMQAASQACFYATMAFAGEGPSG